jgi:predicted XRE-type DNA-binding protein
MLRLEVGVPRQAKGSPEQFWARFRVKPETGCWEWTGGRDADRGYGAVHTAGILPGPGRMISTHRMSWTLKNGPIPEGLDVLHRCDNPPCGNPEHLFLGTNKNNMEDMSRKLRAGQTKLNQEQVDEIRRRWLTGRETQAVIAKSFGVTQPQVSKIVNRKERVLDAVPDAVLVQRKEQRALRPSEVLEIRGRVARGDTHRSIALDYEVVRETVTKIANGKSHGLPPVQGNRRFQLTDEQRQEILKRLTAGETQTALAAEYNVSQPTVSNIKLRAGGVWGQHGFKVES